MKSILKIISTLFFVYILTVHGCALENEMFNRQYDALELGALENSVPSNVKENFKIERNISFDEGLKTLYKRLADEFGDVFKIGLKSAAAILVIASLCGVASSFTSIANNCNVSDYVIIAGALAITAVCSGSLSSVISMGENAVEEISVFSKALLPTLTAAAAATGAPISATVKYAAAAFFSDIIVSVIKEVLFPLVYAYTALSTANAAFNNGTLGKITDFIRKIASGSLKVILTAFVAYISVTGILASAGDSLTVKTARFAINGMVPVVGSVIADATGTVIAGMTMMKNAIGVFGMLTVLSICLTPFLTLGVNCLLFKFSSLIIAPMFENNKLAILVENIGNSFGMVLGMTASGALLVFVSVLSTMKIAGIG